MANDKKEKKEKKHFFKDMKSELKRVTWPTGKQLLNNTIAVITIVLITALIVFILDLGFEALTKNGINGLKAATRKNNETTVVEENNTETEDTEGTNTIEDNNEVVENEEENTTEATTPATVTPETTSEANGQEGTTQETTDTSAE